jgi:type II secretory pathway pseudopilin PulG
MFCCWARERSSKIARPRRGEGGFALLVIFLIAATVAFTMYQELPRAAFESARDKEQLLMDRGNQYKRAIQVYYAVNKRYPAELKDLENTNDKRFLRSLRIAADETQEKEVE